jgi:restriction endonuclease S subunit
MKKNSTKKLELFIRDLGALCLLVALLSIPTKRAVQFINAHQNSLLHELDGTLLAQLHQTREQLLLAERIASARKIISLEEVQEFGTLLDQLEEQYKTNSHGYVLLGPIGSAAIVFKERRIKNSLLQLNDQFRVFLLSLLPSEEEKKQSGRNSEHRTLAESISSNMKLLRSLSR